jgi:hypothetical protein
MHNTFETCEQKEIFCTEFRFLDSLRKKNLLRLKTLFPDGKKNYPEASSSCPVPVLIRFVFYRILGSTAAFCLPDPKPECHMILFTSHLTQGTHPCHLLSTSKHSNQTKLKSKRK